MKLSISEYLKLINSYDLTETLKRIDSVYDSLFIPSIEEFFTSIQFSETNKIIAEILREFMEDNILDYSLASTEIIERLSIIEAKKQGIIVFPSIEYSNVERRFKGVVAAGITALLDGVNDYNDNQDEELLTGKMNRSKGIFVSGGRKVMQQPAIEVSKGSEYVERVVVRNKEMCPECVGLEGVHRQRTPNLYYSHDDCRCLIKPYYSR